MQTLLSPELARDLTDCCQEHLLEHADTLEPARCRTFVRQLESVDWRQVRDLMASVRQGSAGTTGEADRLQRARSPESLVRLPETEAEHQAWREARQAGEHWLRQGKVGAIVVAGGQGTRLGMNQPKGMFPFGPVSGKSLFQWFLEQLRARRERSGQAIPYAIMTSSATHDDTVQFLQDHQYFGLPAEDIFLFQQGNMPSVDLETGRALLTEPGQLAFNPDGHGGLLSALSRSRVLQTWKDRGIETFFYHQIDNPSTVLCDPAMIGWHLHHQADASVKVIAKRSASEKMGVIVQIDGATQVVEYTDLPEQLAALTDDRGRLQFWAGNTAIHIFQREFLERALQSDDALPFHVARKVVPYWDATSGQVTPASPNALKFERFIFDVLPWAQTALVVQGDRATEFSPIKNRSGDDSPETSRALVMAQHRDWLRNAGASVSDEIPVEISPLVALEAGDLRGRISHGMTITEPLYLTESSLHA